MSTLVDLLYVIATGAFAVGGTAMTIWALITLFSDMRNTPG